MLSGSPEFFEENIGNNCLRILHESVSFKSYLSRSTRSLILDLLEKDPRHRLKEASAVKNHEFFNKTDWEALLNKRVKPPRVIDILWFTDSEEESIYFVDRKCDSHQARYRSRGTPKNASMRISGDPFMGFTYATTVGSNIPEKYRKSKHENSTSTNEQLVGKNGTLQSTECSVSIFK